LVGIQFVMSMALTAMSPIYPLMLPGLGVVRLPHRRHRIGRSVSLANRDLVHGLAASATLQRDFAGPATGGTIAAVFGLRSVFVVTRVLLSVLKAQPDDATPLAAD
jgi:hypothetical protein